MKIKTSVLKRVLSVALSAAVLAGTAVATVSAIEPKAETQTLRNVMYYGDWSIWGGEGNFYPKDIPADQLTHLNYAFLDFDSNGNLIFCDKDAATGAPVGMDGVQWGAANAGLLCAFQELRAQNPNLKIGVSVGGWSRCGDFTAMAASDSARANFVSNITKFLKYTNMDFVDLDWEYPNQPREADKVDNGGDEGTPDACPADKQNYIKLLKDLRVALDKQGKEFGKKYELTVALPAPKSKLDAGVDVAELFKVVDFANIMTYDMAGAWDETSGHQTALYTNPLDPKAAAGLSVHDSVQYLMANGAPANKIVVGCAFYTRGWEKVSAGPDASMPGLFGEAALVNKDADQTPSRGARNAAPMKVGDGGRAGGVWGYGSMDKLKAAYPGLKEYWDDIAKAPYLYNEDTGAFFTFDNQRSIREKAKYVKENNLGGIISWMASQDATTTSTKRDELTKTIKDALFGSAPLTDYTIKTAPQNLSTAITTYAEEWNGGAGYEITIKNNEKKNESGETLTLIETAYETVKSPKLYITMNNGATLSEGGYGCGTITNENGYSVVDLATVYDNQTIGQGATCTFKVKSSAADPKLSDIKSIVLVQRILSNGAEVSSQVLYGDGAIGGGEGEVTTVPETTAPEVTTKPEETTIPEVTTKPETTTTPAVTTAPPVDGVPAYDSTKIYNSGDKVFYNGKVYSARWWTQGAAPDGSEWGVWKLVGDSTGGATTTAPIVTTAPSVDGIPAYVPGDIYVGGDKVVYNGKVYTAQWWTNGVPGKDGAWKL